MYLEHDPEWLGYRVEVFDPEKPPKDYAKTIYRLAVDWDSDDTPEDLLASFLEDPRSAETPAILIGQFGESDSSSASIVEALVAAREKLPKLKGIFLGDIISEENEISWIMQSDVGPLFQAFPELEHFRVRGGQGLSLGRIRHDKLKSLILETGGMPVTVLRDVMLSKLPALEHLELWLGDDGYGWDGTVEDIRPFLGVGTFPKLKYLGLRNSMMADEIAEALNGATVLGQIEELDLSLGSMGDAGGEALLKNAALKSLRKLNLYRNYLSKDLAARLAGVAQEVDVGGQEKPDSDDGEEYRYVAVSE